jgi:hypothetical protein
MKRTKTNTEMVEIVTLRRKNKNQAERIAELEKTLSRAYREIETLCAEHGDTGSKNLLAKIDMVINKKEG